MFHETHLDAGDEIVEEKEEEEEEGIGAGIALLLSFVPFLLLGMLFRLFARPSSGVAEHPSEETFGMAPRKMICKVTTLAKKKKIKFDQGQVEAEQRRLAEEKEAVEQATQ